MPRPAAGDAGTMLLLVGEAAASAGPASSAGGWQVHGERGWWAGVKGREQGGSRASVHGAAAAAALHAQPAACPTRQPLPNHPACLTVDAAQRGQLPAKQGAGQGQHVGAPLGHAALERGGVGAQRAEAAVTVQGQGARMLAAGAGWGAFQSCQGGTWPCQRAQQREQQLHGRAHPLRSTSLRKKNPKAATHLAAEPG